MTASILICSVMVQHELQLAEVFRSFGWLGYAAGGGRSSWSVLAAATAYVVRVQAQLPLCHACFMYCVVCALRRGLMTIYYTQLQLIPVMYLLLELSDP
jgi:hypothetical protein